MSLEEMFPLNTKSDDEKTASYRRIILPDILRDAVEKGMTTIELSLDPEIALHLANDLELLFDLVGLSDLDPLDEEGEDPDDES